jgi:predicted MFS family arabinose efflux permease
VVMGLIALAAGAPIAPGFAAAYVLLDRFSVAGAATETFAWNTTMIFVGAAVGAGAGGVLIAQAGGFRAALVLAAALAGAAALSVLAQSRRLL